MCLFLCLFIPAVMFFSFLQTAILALATKMEVNLILSTTLPSFFVSFFTESNPRHHIHAAVEEFRGADGQLSRDSGQ